MAGLLSNQGEKSINSYFIMVPLRKKALKYGTPKSRWRGLESPRFSKSEASARADASSSVSALPQRDSGDRLNRAGGLPSGLPATQSLQNPLRNIP